MNRLAEAQLETQLIEQLETQSYERVIIHDTQGVEDNLQAQLGAFNGTVLSSTEMSAILNHLAKGNIFERAKTLRDRFHLTRDDGTSFYVQFFDSETPSNNRFQVTNQITQEGSYKNRYDVTLLVNGLPLVQIELKRPGIEIKEGFNQILRYKRHSFWTASGLFQFVQIFVISNGVNTKYYANNPIQSLSFKQTFAWADETNRNINELMAFAKVFLDRSHLGRMLSQYVVFNETYKLLMVMRPYQVHATEALIRHVKDNLGNGYIWHTTGSGKTLTSFKAAQIIMDLPEVHKVVFVVDRKDLDFQTMSEFNTFKKGSVDGTDNTRKLIDQLKDDTKLIVTTIQKLNNAITKTRYQKQIHPLKTQRMIFIFDECHRSQFGETHKRITQFFENHQLFGFTGTPIFAENAGMGMMGKRTTADLFGDALHRYVITDAIRDQNVLKFNVEYVGRYKKKGSEDLDIEVEDIDRDEVYNDPERLEKVVKYILRHHGSKTHQQRFSSIFATSSIDNLITYYDLFKHHITDQGSDLRIAAIFTFGPNSDDGAAQGLLPDDYPRVADELQEEYASEHHRDALERIMADYNTQFGTAFSTRDQNGFSDYRTNISKRMKDREKPSFDPKDRLDILLVVDMFLTGFDAKLVNTLYVDKNLRYHGLVQAFSRTNRIINELKSQGNVVCFRNLKARTDDALTLFSDKHAKDVVLTPPYEEVIKKFVAAYVQLIQLAPTVQSVDLLPDEEAQVAFIQAFRALMRLKNVLSSFTGFTWDDLPMDEQAFEGYKSKYLDLYEEVKVSSTKEKDSILDEIDFEVELIHRDEINVAYILKLLARLKRSSQDQYQQQRKALSDLMAGEVQLRSKQELIERFIEENLPHIHDLDTLPDEFEKFWHEQKVLALGQICEEENLDQEEFQALMNTYIFTDQIPLRDDVLKCIHPVPSVLRRREIGDRILEKMQYFVQVFVRGIAA